MPAPNPARRDELADAAIALLARAGAHGLTHRAVERQAALPAGTASNYFPDRAALFAAAAERIAALNRAAMDGIGDRETRLPRVRPTDRRITELITASLLDAVHVGRDRHLAVFELWSESLRRPELRPSMTRLQQVMTAHTLEHHRQLGLTVPAGRVRVLMELYGAVLHSLVLREPGTVDRSVVLPLARAIVRGALTA